MKVLIIESEIYLAQSIASKLTDSGYGCEIVTNANNSLGMKNIYDIVLLSTSLNGQDIFPIIDKFKNSTIILMINYITNDTVSAPLKAGVSDYIQKPFNIEELIRKIKHFDEFKKLKVMNNTYKEYIKSYFSSMKTPYCDLKKVKLPLAVCSTKQQYADFVAFSLMEKLNLSFCMISLDDQAGLRKIEEMVDNTPLYITNFQILKDLEFEKIINLLIKKKVIISTCDLTQSFPFDRIDLTLSEDDFQIQNILSIENYVKYVIANYQNSLPDTELSARLGITRKSLWEKRKKYGIERKK